MYDVIFYIFAAICIVSAAIVVFSRNIAYSAFSLLFTFFGVAGLYIMLGADFVGISQLLIYVGGILVLFLFGMMLTTNIDRLKEDRPTTGRVIPAMLASCGVGGMLLSVIWTNPQWTKAVPAKLPDSDTTAMIGRLFMGDFSLMFVASAIAILVALVGAAMIARSDRLTPEDAAERM
jgi:NADH-quinone oxidoreductase subunit J